MNPHRAASLSGIAFAVSFLFRSPATTRMTTRTNPKGTKSIFLRVSIAAAMLLAASGTAIAVLASPNGATAAGSLHTLHVTAKRAAEVQYKTGGFTEADKIQSNSGKALGTDVSDCTPVSSKNADCTGVVGLDGGLLDSSFSLNFATGAIKGTITGGTMAYRHVTGTITGSSFNGGSHLTFSYH